MKFIPFEGLDYTEEESIERSKSFFEFLDKRRSVRSFSDKPVPKIVIDNIIKAASSAPSGAHKQPWTFCIVSNTDLKRKIRELAEHEEKINYDSRMSDRWKKDLTPIGTNHVKEFIDVAPWIIVVMKRVFEIDNDGTKHNNYYVNESIGLASGFLLAAIHNAGLVTLTHTPSPMNFLLKALDRPKNERPFLLIPVGYPAKEAKVPDLTRKSLQDVAVYYE